MELYSYKRKKKKGKYIVFLLLIVFIILGINFFKNGCSVKFWKNKYVSIEEKILLSEKEPKPGKKKKILLSAETAALNAYKNNITDYILCSYLGDIYSGLAGLETDKELHDNLLDKSISYYRKAIAFDQGEILAGVVNYQLGLAYFNKGTYYYYQAMTQLNRALKLKYENDTIHKLLGIIYLTKGEPEKAKKEFENIVIEDNDYKMKYFIASAYKNSKQYQEAIKIYKELLDNCKDPSLLFKSYLGLGWLYYRLYLVDKSVESYNSAVKLDPDDPFPYYWLGKVYLRKKNKKRARFYFSLALKKDNNYMDAKEQIRKLK